MKPVAFPCSQLHLSKTPIYSKTQFGPFIDRPLSEPPPYLSHQGAIAPSRSRREQHKTKQLSPPRHLLCIHNHLIDRTCHHQIRLYYIHVTPQSYGYVSVPCELFLSGCTNLPLTDSQVYKGSDEILLSKLILDPSHSILTQSFDSRLRLVSYSQPSLSSPAVS